MYVRVCVCVCACVGDVKSSDVSALIEWSVGSKGSTAAVVWFTADIDVNTQGDWREG